MNKILSQALKKAVSEYSPQVKEVSKINKKCWDRLSSMAFETYVPESEASKSGAGY